MKKKKQLKEDEPNIQKTHPTTDDFLHKCERLEAVHERPLWTRRRSAPSVNLLQTFLPFLYPLV